MICTRNGVVVRLEEYGDCRRADLYLLGDDLVLRTTNQPVIGIGSAHIIVDAVHHWFDENQDYGTMIVLDGRWRLTPAGETFINGD